MRSKKLQKFSAVSMKCLKIGNKFFEMKKITLEAYFVKFRICLSVLPFWNSPLKKLCRVEISDVENLEVFLFKGEISCQSKIIKLRILK